LFTILIGFVDKSLDQFLPLDSGFLEPSTGEPRWKVSHCKVPMMRNNTYPLQKEKGNTQNGNISTAQTPPPVTNLFDKTSVDSAASFINLSPSEAGLWPYNTCSVRPALYLKHN